MRLSDFELKRRSEAVSGDADVVWKEASAGAVIAVGIYRGKKYQIKVRAGKPKWFHAQEKIDALKTAARSESDEEVRARIDSERASWEAGKEGYDEKDRKHDEFLSIKNTTYRKVNGIGKPELFSCADEIWKEPIEFKGNEIYCVEAAPWLNIDIPVVADGSHPIGFRNLSQNEQYELIADFADNLQILHDNDIVHSDLKVGNTLIVQSEGRRRVAIIDYDCSFLLNDLKNKRYSRYAWSFVLGGTYFAPEFYEFKKSIGNKNDQEKFNEADSSKLSYKMDIYSMAVTIWEYYFGDASVNKIPYVNADGTPYEGATDNFYCNAALAGAKPKLPTDDEPNALEETLYYMLNWMLEPNPNDRPDAKTVAKVFRTRDFSIVPGKYKKVDFGTLPEDADIEFIPKPGVKVMWVPNSEGVYDGKKFYYQYDNGNKSSTRRKAEIIAEGYARRKGGASSSGTSTGGASVGGTAPRGASAGAAGTPWPSDNLPAGTVLPACIVRKEGEDGKYVITERGVFKSTVAMPKLLALGFFCSEEDKHRLWPNDALRAGNLVLNPRYNITRDFDLGPGQYVCQPVEYAGTTTRISKNKFDEMVRLGIIKPPATGGSGTSSTGSSGSTSGVGAGRFTFGSSAPATIDLCKPFDSDHIEFIKENMVGVARIARKMQPGNYTITYSDASKGIESCTAQGLIDKGYAKRV